MSTLKKCDKCSLCCKILPIQEIKKPENKPWFYFYILCFRILHIFSVSKQKSSFFHYYGYSCGYYWICSSYWRFTFSCICSWFWSHWSNTYHQWCRSPFQSFQFVCMIFIFGVVLLVPI